MFAINRASRDDGDDFSYHLYFRCAAGLLPSQRREMYRLAKSDQSDSIVRTFAYMHALTEGPSMWSSSHRPPYVTPSLQYPTLSLFLHAIAASGNTTMFMLLMRRIPREMVTLLQGSIIDSYAAALETIGDSRNPSIARADALMEQLHHLIPIPDADLREGHAWTEKSSLVYAQLLRVLMNQRASTSTSTSTAASTTAAGAVALVANDDDDAPIIPLSPQLEQRVSDIIEEVIQSGVRVSQEFASVMFRGWAVRTGMQPHRVMFECRSSFIPPPPRFHTV
jgi:hypothetical protein